jgi:hypothetical protein
MILVIGYLSSASILIPFIFLLFSHKELQKESFLIQIYILIGVFTETINIFLKGQLSNNTIISSNIFTLLEVGLILFSLNQWSFNSRNRYIYLTLLSIYIFIWIYCAKANGIGKLSSLVNGPEALFIITATILFLYNKFMNEEGSFPKWQITISVAFLFYFIVNSGIYSFTELFLSLEQKENWIYFSLIHFIGNLGLNIILAKGLYQCSKQ